jgi:hypothetical protein
MPVASRLQVCEATPLLTPTLFLLLLRLIPGFLTACEVSLLVGGVRGRIQTLESLKEARAPYPPPPLTRQSVGCQQQNKQLRIQHSHPSRRTSKQLGAASCCLTRNKPTTNPLCATVRLDCYEPGTRRLRRCTISDSTTPAILPAQGYTCAFWPRHPGYLNRPVCLFAARVRRPILHRPKQSPHSHRVRSIPQRRCHRIRQ